MATYALILHLVTTLLAAELIIQLLDNVFNALLVLSLSMASVKTEK